MKTTKDYYLVKAIQHSNGYILYLENGSDGWGWVGDHYTSDREKFGTVREAKAKMRNNTVRRIRALKENDGPMFKVLIVRTTNPWWSGNDTIVWPKDLIPVLDRLAAI